MADFNGTEYFMGQVMDIIGLEVKAQLIGASSLVPTIIGDPGIGKSASLKAKAKELNMDYLILSLGALPMEWFSGLPDFADETFDKSYAVDGKLDARVTEWTMSDIVRTIIKKTDSVLKSGKEGLLVLLDDMHLVEPMVQKYLFEFFQNKTLQGYNIPEKAVLVGAMNGKSSAGLEGFHSAVINRMAMYSAKFDKKFWYENIGLHLHPYVASFASGPNDKYFNGANQTDAASPSPRSWTELSQFIPLLEEEAADTNMLNSALQIAAEARVGKEAAIEFMKHVKLFQKFNFKEMLKKGDTSYKISSDISDQILTAFVIRYMETKKDAEFIYELIKNNKEQRTFISVMLNEYGVLYRNFHSLEKGSRKDAIEHLSKILTDEKMDSELVTLVCDALMDVA